MSDPTQGIVRVIVGENEGQYVAATVNGVPTAYGTATQDNVLASGVLIAPDEVLTAAHVVKAADGGVRDYGTVTPGYTDGSSATTGTATSNVHFDPGYVTSTSNTAGNVSHDFAVIHLATPVTGVPIFSLASLSSGGAVTVSGYPSGLGGDYDSLQETVTPDLTAGVLDGTSLGKGTNPEGSSGGPVWSVVNGDPTVYGVVSGADVTNSTKGVFTSLTAADIAEIQGWISADHPATSTSPLPVSTPTPVATPIPGPTPVTIMQSPPVPTQVQVAASQGMSAFVADSVAGDAASYGGGRAVVMGDVAAAITQAVSEGGDYQTMLQDAGSWVESNSSMPRRALAYLGGLLQGASSGTNARLFGNVDDMFGGGVVTDQATARATNAGFAEGASMHPSIASLATAISNTTAAVSSTDAATWHDTGLAASAMLTKHAA